MAKRIITAEEIRNVAEFNGEVAKLIKKYNLQTICIDFPTYSNEGRIEFTTAEQHKFNTEEETKKQSEIIEA